MKKTKRGPFYETLCNIRKLKQSFTSHEALSGADNRFFNLQPECQTPVYTARL